MRGHRDRTPTQIMEVVARHHSLQVMARRAAIFRERFAQNDWILDIGGGSGWYWRGTRGANVVLVDFSIESLYAARKLLSDGDRVLLLHVDAGHLPFRPHALAGFWSVQVLQHLPPEIISAVLMELRRVLRSDYQAEIYNLNYALLHRVIYRLAGRRLHRSGTIGSYLLNRLTAREWCEALQPLLANTPARLRVSTSHSELFFHPNCRLLQRRYPVALETFISERLPRLAALFARQVQLVIRP